jgi:hypothetical protein
MKTRGKDENLLKNKYPHLLLEWDYVKNSEININTISYASHKKVHWLCPKKIEEHKYETSVHSRTLLKKNGNLTGCKKCHVDSLRFQDEMLVMNHKKEYKQIKNTALIGDETENYVMDLLKSMRYYEFIENLGNLSADADISVSLNDVTYYIQVKTMVTQGKDVYKINYNPNYPNNMLLLMINKDRDRFALQFAGELKGNICLTYTYENCKHKDIMYDDINKFKIKLKELIPLSSTKITFISEDVKKEYLSLQRFQSFCLKNNIKYIRNPSNADSVDGTINGSPFQAKYVTKNRTENSYDISSHRNAGSLNGQTMYDSYKINDFKYMIVEVGGTIQEKDIYQGNFCIIPHEELIKQGILSSDTCKGKKSFHICKPDSDKNHWSKKYWNNISDELITFHS